jgi:CubicO group peptidase (beta-lactamase class C family)
MGFAGNVSKPALHTGLEKEPGTFDYKSVNTQLLALIIEKATGKKLQDYAAEKLWQPLGMEHQATWNIDKKGTVRAFCCINAAARDYAKFGSLFLHNGRWQGKQIVLQSWVQQSTHLDTMAKYGGYKNQWWSRVSRKLFTTRGEAEAFVKTKAAASVKAILPKNSGEIQYRAEWRDAYFAQGILGQYVYVNPSKNLVIVRLGHYWSHPKYYAEGFISHLAQEL